MTAPLYIDRAIVGDGAAVNGGAVQLQRVAAVDLDDGAAGGVGKGRPVHRDVVQRQRHPALDRHPAIVQGRVAIDRGRAIDIDYAGTAFCAVIDGAAIDGDAAVERQRVAVVDLDGAVVDDRTAGYSDVVQRQRSAAVDLDNRPGGGVGEGGAGHRDVVQRQRHTALDRHPATVQQRIDRGKAVVDGGAIDGAVAGNIDRAVVGDDAAIDGGAVQLQRGAAVDLNNAAGIGDGDLDIERAARDLDRPGIRDAALINEITAMGEIDRAGILQNALIQDLRKAADADGPEILDDRVGAQDSSRPPIVRVLRLSSSGGVSPEVIHGHGFGERCSATIKSRLDRDRIIRRLPLQLIGNDDGIVVCRGNGSGFPVRRIVPVPRRG